MKESAQTLTTLVAPRGAAPRDALGREARCIEDALSGDDKAFSRLVRPHLTLLYRLAARVSGHESLAEDALQEALIIVHKNLASYKVGTSLKAWMARIVVTRAKTLSRSERRRLSREETSRGPATLPGPSGSLDARELSERIASALESMPSKRREALILKLDGGLSAKEIAQALGSSEGSVRVLLHLGMKALKAALSSGHEEEGKSEHG